MIINDRSYRRACVLAATVVVSLTAAACDNRDRPTIPVFGNLAVISDPEGAQIALDGRILSDITPTTLEGVEAGEHFLELAATPGALEFFGWADTVTVPEETVDTVRAALEGGCRRNCPFVMDNGRILCRSTGRGDTCATVFFDNLDALVWPGSNGGSYGAGGRLLLAGVFGASAGPRAGDTISTQVYDLAWTGRAPMRESETGNRQEMVLEYWGSSRYATESMQGLEVKQTLISIDSAGVEDVLFIQFEIVNISDDERYRALYPWIPEGGYTYESLYVGFGLDADVGSSEDDLGTFDTDLDLSFMYDAFLQDPVLGAFEERPALVGLVTAEPPVDATERTFTLWSRQEDWDDTDDHGFAWRLLAGRLSASDPIDNHPSPEIGYQGTTPDDYRLIEAFGPLSLAPQESLSLTVALVLAFPVPGTYTPGVLMSPGDPIDPSRQVLVVADSLRALAAQIPVLWDRYHP